MTNEKKSYYKWKLLALLWFAYFFNQADRQIYNNLLPHIKGELGLSDVQAGSISSIFILTIGISIPIAGLIGDFFNRKGIITLCILLWSVGTFFTGFANSALYLILVFGILVGAGESFYAPSANALIGEYHVKTRGLAMSIHQTAYYSGIITSGFLAGYIAEHYGWRNNFFILGSTGIILSLVIFLFLKKTPVTRKDANSIKAVKESFVYFFTNPTALLLTLAFAGKLFATVGYLTWAPTFLYEKYHYPLGKAGLYSMIFYHAGAFTGILLGGQLSDIMALRSKNARMILIGVALLAGIPFIIWTGQASDVVSMFAAMILFGIFRGIYDSNNYATLFDVIKPKYRSSAVGFEAMGGFIIGAIAPILLGYLKPLIGLSGGISFLSFGYLVAGCSVFIALKYFFTNDYNKACIIRN
jgi:MFS family permease